MFKFVDFFLDVFKPTNKKVFMIVQNQCIKKKAFHHCKYLKFNFLTFYYYYLRLFVLIVFFF